MRYLVEEVGMERLWNASAGGAVEVLLQVADHGPSRQQPVRCLAEGQPCGPPIGRAGVAVEVRTGMHVYLLPALEVLVHPNAVRMVTRKGSRLRATLTFNDASPCPTG